MMVTMTLFAMTPHVPSGQSLAAELSGSSYPARDGVDQLLISVISKKQSGCLNLYLHRYTTASQNLSLTSFFSPSLPTLLFLSLCSPSQSPPPSPSLLSSPSPSLPPSPSPPLSPSSSFPLSLSPSFPLSPLPSLPSPPPVDKTSHLYAYVHIHERAVVIQD